MSIKIKSKIRTSDGREITFVAENDLFSRRKNYGMDFAVGTIEK
jgi:hypothetical protein